MKLIPFIILTVLGASSASADTVQIQLKGNTPKTFSANLIWQDTLSSGCVSSPCNIKQSKVRIKRHSSGAGVTNVDVPAGATRACLNNYGKRSLVTDTVLFMKNGKQYKTSREGGNVEANGLSACSFPRAQISDAKLWIVNIQ